MRYVICMKWGTKFGPEYVNSLRRMVKKHLTLPHEFVCFTDDASGLDSDIVVYDLPDFIELEPNAPERGWRKLSLFNKNLNGMTGQALFLDLDIIIRSNIDCFFQKQGDFLIIKDWDFPNDIIGNSSVFRFQIGELAYVLDYFINNKNVVRQKFRNEQAYLSYVINAHGGLKYWAPEWCVSFKRHCLRNWPMCYFQGPIDPCSAKIVVFHGKPTPEQARDGYIGKYGFRYVKPTKWLDKYWERG